MIEVVASDEEVIRQHQEAKKLAELVARVERERTSTGDSVRKAMRRMDEFSLVCSEEDCRTENALADNEAVSSKETVDGYLAELIDRTKVLGPMFAPALSTLILNSVDPDFRCKLRHIPSSAVSVDRCMAHVESMRLSQNRKTISRLARLVMLALLNRRVARQAREVDVAIPKVRPKQDEPRHEPVRHEKAMEPPPTPRTVQRPEVEAPPGREIAGYAEAVVETSWSLDGAFVKMPKGEPLLLVTPLGAEREGFRSDGSTLAWWRGKARKMPPNSVAPIRLDDYLRRTSAPVLASE